MSTSVMQSEILSLSIDPNFLKETELARKEHGFTSRSEFWRRAMANFLDTLAIPLRGRIRGALIVVHDESKDRVIDQLKHDKAVKTHLHSHLRNECLEVLIVDGPSTRVTKMLHALRKDRSIRFVKLIT